MRKYLSEYGINLSASTRVSLIKRLYLEIKSYLETGQIPEYLMNDEKENIPPPVVLEPGETKPDRQIYSQLD